MPFTTVSGGSTPQMGTLPWFVPWVPPAGTLVRLAFKAEPSWGSRDPGGTRDTHKPRDRARIGHEHLKTMNSPLPLSAPEARLVSLPCPTSCQWAPVGQGGLGESPGRIHGAWHRDSADECSDKHAHLPTAPTCPAQLSFLLMSGPRGRCQDARVPGCGCREHHLASTPTLTWPRGLHPL